MSFSTRSSSVHFDVHYVVPSSTRTSCNRRLDHLRWTNKLKETTCPSCLGSDEYLAQGMEEALNGGDLVLVDDQGLIYQSWRTGESCKNFDVTNTTRAVRVFKLLRRNGQVVMQVAVATGLTYSWRANFGEEIIA